MSLWLALLLGIIQGLTEFFPVSSSAHLKLIKLLFHLPTDESVVLFDLSCHFGTLLALLFFLRPTLRRLLFDERIKLGLLALALLPLFPAYFLLKPLRTYFSGDGFLGLFLVLTGVFLFLSDRIRLHRSKGKKDALWIGAMQSVALIPGVSRSASTIFCAKALGWSGKEAVEFSFLLAIPTIVGGNFLELMKHFSYSNGTQGVSFSSCLIGFLSSLVVGRLVVRVALRRLSHGPLTPFGWYCITVGIFAMIFLYR